MPAHDDRPLLALSREMVGSKNPPYSLPPTAPPHYRRIHATLPYYLYMGLPVKGSVLLGHWSDCFVMANVKRGNGIRWPNDRVPYEIDAGDFPAGTGARAKVVGR